MELRVIRRFGLLSILLRSRERAFSGVTLPIMVSTGSGPCLRFEAVVDLVLLASLPDL